MAESQDETGKMPEIQKKRRRGPIKFMSDTIRGAARLAGQGLVVAVVMGIVFGFAIAFGGRALNMETAELVKLAGMSGWISGLAAMFFVFHKAWRGNRD